MRGARATALAARSLLLFAPAGLAVACATEPPTFVPADESGSSSFVAAYYQIDVGGKRHGDVRVWSPPPRQAGATNGREAAAADDGAARLQVDLRIRNDGEAPIELDVARTTVDLLVGGDFVASTAPPRVRGNPVVPPAGVQRLQLEYALPADVPLRDLTGYELSWTVRTPDGIFTQSTPFVRRMRQPSAGAYGPYYHVAPYWYGYDPFWHGRFHYWW